MLTLETLTNKNKSKKRLTNSNNSWLKCMILSKSKGLKTSKKKKTLYDINVWKRYLTSAGEERNSEDIRAKDLSVHMPCFFMEIKKDGDQYEPTTLTSFQRSLQ